MTIRVRQVFLLLFLVLGALLYAPGPAAAQAATTVFAEHVLERGHTVWGTCRELKSVRAAPTLNGCIEEVGRDNAIADFHRIPAGTVLKIAMKAVPGDAPRASTGPASPPNQSDISRLQTELDTVTRERDSLKAGSTLPWIVALVFALASAVTGFFLYLAHRPRQPRAYAPVRQPQETPREEPRLMEVREDTPEDEPLASAPLPGELDERDETPDLFKNPFPGELDADRFGPPHGTRPH